jgi:hypothetical protein
MSTQPSHQPRVQYRFESGATDVACRPFTSAEWDRLLKTMIESPLRRSNNGSAAPVALFVSGIPGGGVVFITGCALAHYSD